MDLGMVQVDDFLYNGQSKSGTIVIFSALIIAFEDKRQLIGTNSFAGICNGNADPAFFLGFYFNVDIIAFMAKSDGIVDQVLQHPVNEQQISLNHKCILGYKSIDTDSFFARKDPVFI